VSTLSTLIQHCHRIPRQSNKLGRRNKRNSNRKGRSQTIPILDDMILYLKDSRNSRHHKHLQQSSRIQNQFTKTSSLSIYEQWTDWESI
jgi:hypothetical protein